MIFWTYQHIADVTQGAWLVEPADLGDAVTGLWHDTREIKPGQAYLAIKGDNFDGHDFVGKAFDAGAALAIVSTDPPCLEGEAEGRGPSQPVLKVKDTVAALQDLARAYRDELMAPSGGGCKVIGIAGSNGKTTTRHLIHHVLTHAGLKGTQSPKSFNNHLGVPLTLLQAKPTDDFVACEIGTNHPGEIDFLSAIARPDIAVITSIGEEHLEFFKTVRGVAREESSIISHVVDSGGFVTTEGDWQKYLKKHCKRTDVSIHHEWYNWRRISKLNQEINYTGPIQNLELTGTVAMLFEIELEKIDESLKSIPSLSGRREKLAFNGLTVINDAYNANPSSVDVAMDSFDRHHKFRNVFIFGDMFELGEKAAELHGSIGCHITVMRTIDCLITIGPLAANACKFIEICEPEMLASGEITTHTFPEWSDDLPDQVAALLQPGDTVLLKASRGMRLERLIPAIERRFGPPQDDEPT